MTPIPLHLPLRPNEAAEVAALIFEHAERKPLTDELRNRLSARTPALNLTGMVPWFGSLAQDPAHPSVYYLAVDGIDGQPLLLHIALATAPSSGLFPKALLIGRTRRMSGPEFVVNAVPFGPCDREHIERFAAEVDSAFLPRPQGSRSSITIRSEYARAFDFFRATQKRRGRNIAAVAGDYHECLWAAIRAGWRQEYSVVAEISTDRTCDVVRDTLAYTRFAVRAADLKMAAQEHEEIRQARALLKAGSDFEFEVELGDVSAAELATSLEWLKQQGHSPQLAGVGIGDSEALAEVARQHRITLSFRYAGESGAKIERASKATAGRLNYYVNTPAEAETVAEYLLG